MRTNLTNWFLAEPRIRSAGFRYGLLASILALLLVQALVAIHLSASHQAGKPAGFILVLTLLFSHLAFQFRWTQPVTLALRVIACLWIACAMTYSLFLVVTL